MPELPEVEIVRRGMERAILDKNIQSVKINRYDLRIPVPQDFGQTVTGKKVEKLSRRGKYIIIDLGGNIVGVLHLGMSGRVRIFSPDDSYKAEKHDHLVFTMEDGTCFAYEDPRRFGMFYLAANDWERQKPFVSMGPEPLGEWPDDSFFESLQNKKAPIKTVLLDQHVVAGLGNIYVCEALYRAEVDPRRVANTITREEAKKIRAFSRTVLEEAIEVGGSTLKDYQHTDGSLGYFQHRFSVYDQENEECANKKCSAKIERFVQAGRSTFYCPSCQK